MKLLMISGDRSILQGKKGAFWYTLEEFSKHWDRVDVICPKVRELGVGSGELGFKNVFFHPNPKGLITQSGWIRRKGKELINEHHHDVGTVHCYPPFYNSSGARKLPIPYALEVHHIVGYPNPSSLSEKIGLFMSRRYLSKAINKSVAVRTVNGGAAEVLAKWGADLSKISVVPSFYLDRKLIESIPSPEKEYDVVFCGRLVKNKAVDVLLEAIAQTQDAKLLIIGDGPEKSALQKLAKKIKIDDRVTWKGWLETQEEVFVAIKSSRVFVMCSTSEGGPRSALEAMACGVPVISTRVGVMQDVIEDGVNGVFTDGTSEDLAVQIEGLLADQDHLRRIGDEAKKILDRFERSTLIKGYADFLKSLV